MEDGTASTAPHDLLLTLAGRVDDDLLAWVRELVAVEEDARALELLVASLVADRAVLPHDVRSQLVSAARTARIELDADAALLPSGREEDTGHRFDPGPAGDAVATAVLALPERQLRDCRVLVTRRLTPAGSAPGPLPHPVVIVEVEPDGRPAAVLAYQVGVALERSGVLASVEVLTAGTPVPAYHAAALRSARPLSDEGGAGPPAEEPAGPVGSAPPPVEPAPPTVEPALPPVEPAPPTVPSDPPPADVENGTAAPSRLPLRSVEPPPAAPVATDPAPDLFALSPIAGPRPWSEPGIGDAMSQRVRRPTVTSIARRAPAPVDEAPDGPGPGDPGPGDPGPEPGQSEENWSGEWLSGAWTMASVEEPDGERPTAPHPDHHPPRHRFHGEADDHDDPAPPAPAGDDPGPVATALGLRPESLARMSDENRDLLARLRAELSAGRPVPEGPNDTENGSG